MSAFSQTFTCEKLANDIKSWNELTNKKDNVKWANAIMNKGLYKQNNDGSFEYVYILTTTDSVDVNTLRKIGFDFIGYKFANITNELRSDMMTNSPKDGVYFKGKITNVGIFDSFFEANHIHSNIIFDIRFKPNRIRFSIKVQNYQVVKVSSAGVTQNYTVYVNDCYPLNEKSDHKKSYAMAFINSNSNCMNYADSFVKYINSNLSNPEVKELEDW